MPRALPVLVLALLVAACGGDDARETVVDAAQRTAQQGGLRAEVNGEVRAPALPQPVPITATALVADAGERVRVSAQLKGRTGAERVARALSASETIMIGDDAWFRFPRGGDLLPEGVEWLSADAETQKRLGVGSTPAGLGATDPTDVLDTLGQRASEAEREGSEEVRGVATTRYTTTVESDAGQGTNATVPTEVWIGEDGLVRRIRQKVETGKATATYAVEYFDFGVRTDIEPPPEDVTAPIEEVFGRRGG